MYRNGIYRLLTVPRPTAGIEAPLLSLKLEATIVLLLCVAVAVADRAALSTDASMLTDVQDGESVWYKGKKLLPWRVQGIGPRCE